MRLQAYIDLGWSPVLANVSTGASVVQEVVSWVGGNGTAPATGLYIGSNGFVTNITDGVNLAVANVLNLSAGTTSNNLSNVIFSNSNGVSFGLNGSTITASVVAGGGGGAVNFSAGTTSNNLTEITFSNSNGVSFGLNGSTMTASVATSLTNMNFSAGTTSNNLSAITFSNSNRVSFGLNGSVITAQHALNFSAGTTSNNISDGVTFANGNGVSFGLNGSTMTASIATSLTNMNISAGTTSNNLSAVTFANGNGVSFGLNGSTVTASVATSLTNMNVSAGTTSNNLSAITFSNSNRVSFGLNGSVITAQHALNFSAGTTSNNITDGVTFANGNGVSFGLNASTITASIATSLTNINFSAGTTSNNLSAITFNNGNGVSFGLNGSTVTASHNGVTSQTNQNISFFGLGNTTQNSSTVLNASVVSLNGLGDVTVGYSNGSIQLSVTQSNQAFSAAGGSSAFQTLGFSDNSNLSWTNTNGSVAVASVRASLYAVSNTTQSSSGTQNLNALSFAGAGIASVGITNGSVIVSVPSGGGAGDGYNIVSMLTSTSGGGTAGATFSTLSGSIGLMAGSNITLSQTSNTINIIGNTFSNSNNITFGLNAGTVTASYNFNASAGTTSNNLNSIVFSDSNGISFGLNGSTVTAKHALNFSAGTTSNDISDQVVFSNSNGISFGLNGSTVTAQQGYMSFYENMAGIYGSSALTWNAASISHVAPFIVGMPLSASFIRLIGLMTTNSTTIATMASASASASGALYSTINAVVYSLGVGASSRSLQSVASGSGGYTMSQKISVTNSTQASYSLGFTAEVEGQAGRTNLTTQYSVSNTNYSFTTDQIGTNFSSVRYLDIPFANSLSQGAYWVIIGQSTSSASGGAAGLAALTNCNVRYSAHYGASNAVLSIGVMGSTNRTSNGLAFSFSTAGGGTTNSLPISALSSMASNARMYFQMIRSV